jgi:hypothetical protein
MPEHKKQPMGMPRSSLMSLAGNEREFVAIVAHALAITFTVLSLASVLVFFPALIAAYNSAGVTDAELPLFVSMAEKLGWLGQIVLIPLVNALIYWFFFKQAKRTWAGLAFVPLIIYMMLGFFITLAMVVPLLGVL